MGLVCFRVWAAAMLNRLNQDLKFHQTALNVRAWRQELLASNIANADTPHYKARDVDFKQALQAALGQPLLDARGQPVQQPLPLARTQGSHRSGLGVSPLEAGLMYRTELQSSVDGNTVDMNTERAAFADNALQFEAMLTFINGKLKTMGLALQP